MKTQLDVSDEFRKNISESRREWHSTVPFVARFKDLTVVISSNCD